MVDGVVVVLMQEVHCLVDGGVGAECLVSGTGVHLSETGQKETASHDPHLAARAPAEGAPGGPVRPEVEVVAQSGVVPPVQDSDGLGTDDQL